MNANNTLRQRANTIGAPPYHDDHKDDSFVYCPEWGCGFEGQIFSRSLSSSTDSTSDCVTDDSVEIDSSQLEDKHFAKALNQGVFNSVYEQNRKDRRKSFEKEQHHHHHHHGHHHHHHRNRKSLEDFTNNNDENESPMYMRRPRSKSFEVKNDANEHSHRRKKMSKHRKLRQELSNSGIDLKAKTESLSIDEIYEMQNRFFSSLKLSPDYLKQYSHEDLSHRDAPCSPIHKTRSPTWH